jgi:hypothetical protein
VSRLIVCGRPAAAIHMCDPPSRNMPADLKTIVANCLSHARRNFYELTEVSAPRGSTFWSGEALQRAARDLGRGLAGRHPVYTLNSLNRRPRIGVHLKRPISTGGTNWAM